VYIHGYFVNQLLKRIGGQFDLINVHTPLPPVPTISLPIVTTVHSPMKADTAATTVRSAKTIALRLQAPVSQQIERTLFRHSKQITAVAGWVAEALHSYGVERTQVTVTGNGVEESFFSCSSVPQRESFILYVGRLEASKGVQELIEAAKIILDRDPKAPLRIVLVGKGPMQPTLEKLVKQAGLQPFVSFIGHMGMECREKLVEMYRRASIFVLPSHHEGMPTVLLEAMATGAPVISTAVGGACEVVNHGENGLLVPPREPEALADALLLLLNNPMLRHHLGQHAQQSVAQEYSWDRVCQRYLSCYEQAFDRKVVQ
jgi:glycosyltransferase involved in cell wall biosynthesis